MAEGDVVLLISEAVTFCSAVLALRLVCNIPCNAVMTQCPHQSQQLLSHQTTSHEQNSFVLHLLHKVAGIKSWIRLSVLDIDPIHQFDEQ